MDQTQAQFLAQCLCKLWEGEFPATCKVLAAVPDDKRSYRPDEKSRTAWELATHIATGDIWFINSVLAGSFVFDAEAEKKQAGQFGSIADVVDVLQEGIPRGARQGAGNASRQAGGACGLLWHDEDAERDLPGLCQQPLDTSSGSAGRLPARDGIQGSGNLRRQCR